MPQYTVTPKNTPDADALRENGMSVPDIKDAWRNALNDVREDIESVKQNNPNETLNILWTHWANATMVVETSEEMAEKLKKQPKIGSVENTPVVRIDNDGPDRIFKKPSIN